MKPNRVTGPLLALALICAPAIPALAKPVSTHVVEVDWVVSESDVFTNGFVTVTHDELGQTSVDLLIFENSVVDCGGGSQGTMSRSVSHSGPVDLAFTVDRHMDEASLVGSISVTESTSVFCFGSPTVNSVQQSTTELELLAFAVDRPVRSRDRETGTRYIVRPANVTVSVGAATYADQGLLTEEISRG